MISIPIPIAYYIINGILYRIILITYVVMMSILILTITITTLAIIVHIYTYGRTIVSLIIPKELFQTTCEVLHIGREYGFYINTYPDHGYDYYSGDIYSGNYKSDVLVFDLFGRGDIGGIVGTNFGGLVIYCSTEDVIISYLFYTSNRSIGGIIGYQTTGTVAYCYSSANLYYSNIESNDDAVGRQLAPAMAQIVGCAEYMPGAYCYGYGSANKGSLKTLTWKTGIWPFRTEHIHDQAQYVSPYGVGRVVNP